MISQRAETPIVAFSVRLYRVFLVAYPTKFQQEYGAEMVQVFQDCCLRAVRQGGTNGMVKLWTVTLLDLIQSVISEHTQKEVQMKKEMNPEDVRLAGGALIWGAVAFVIGIFLLVTRAPNLWGVSFMLIIYISMPLLVAGLLGVRKRYGEKVGRFGRNILFAGAILGPLTSVILLVLLDKIEINWIVAFSGHAVLLACLALFGVVALYEKPLPHWNVTPIIAGILYPIMLLFYSTTRTTLDWEVPISVNVAIVFGIQCIALAALGYILKSDLPE